MKFKHSLIFVLLLGLFSVITSCNDNDNEFNLDSTSMDVQVYKFSLSAPLKYAKDATDSLTYPLVASTIFAIDQYKGVIYNPDSMAYKTRLGVFDPEFMFSSQSYLPRKITFQYYGDSSHVWQNENDSIDFSLVRGVDVEPNTNNAPSGSNKSYRFDFRVHQVDPDTIVWSEYPNLKMSIDRQKTVMLDGKFHCYYTVFGQNKIELSVLDPVTAQWQTENLQALPSSIKVGSIYVYKDILYGIDANGDLYKSVDGIQWTNEGHGNFHNILGIVPNEEEKDSPLLMTVNNGAKYEFAYSYDMASFPLAKVKGAPNSNLSEVDKFFPSHDFSSVTNLDGERSLLLTGGVDFTGTLKNNTWSMNYRDDLLEVAPINKMPGKEMKAKEGRATFQYDKKLYAVNDSIFLTSYNQGAKWLEAPLKQRLSPTMKDTERQSVIVDEKNNIWFFGLNTSSAMQYLIVRKGKLNRLD